MSSELRRLPDNDRFSGAVIHNGVVYLRGMTSNDGSSDIRGQTRNVLARIDDYLARAGTDKTRILRAEVWLANVARDTAAFNEVWLEWADPAALPARATGEVPLTKPEFLLEIIVTAAL